MAILHKDYFYRTVRAAAILTGTYVAAKVYEEGVGGSKVLDCTQYDQLQVLVDFTIGSLTSLEIKVEYSTDDTTYWQQTFTTVSAGESTASLGNYKMTATGKYVLEIPILARYIQISAKGTGTVTSSSVTVNAILGNTN